MTSPATCIVVAPAVRKLGAMESLEAGPARGLRGNYASPLGPP
jgi:hypothetical protein